MIKKPNSTLGGLAALIGSTLIYAMSGVVVVGLLDTFGQIGQLVPRALIAGLFSFFWLILFSKGFKLSKTYHRGWLSVYMFFRPITNFLFILAVVAIGPTSAIFYLFAGRVLTGALIKAVTRYWGSSGRYWAFLSYSMVMVGLFVYTGQITFGVGMIWGLLTGAFEAVKMRAINQLELTDEDKPKLAIYDFGILATVAFIGVLIFQNGVFVLHPISPYVYFVLFLSGLVAIGTTILDMYGFVNFDDDLGNVVQSSELGFAGLLNYWILGTLMTTNQVVGMFVLMLSLVIAVIAESKRTKSMKRSAF